MGNFCSERQEGLFTGDPVVQEHIELFQMLFWRSLSVLERARELPCWFATLESPDLALALGNEQYKL